VWLDKVSYNFVNQNHSVHIYRICKMVDGLIVLNWMLPKKLIKVKLPNLHNFFDSRLQIMNCPVISFLLQRLAFKFIDGRISDMFYR
jgi:hypothetical protein